MIIEAVAFYIFAGLAVLSGFLVITARNPVYAVLFLILAFFSSAGLFVLLGAEFIAMLMIIVYVGAVAVLFLFVVMMLDISFADLRKDAMQYVPIGLVVGSILLGELVFIYISWEYSPDLRANMALPVSDFAESTNTESLGQVLYTDYILPFQLAGLILFVAMIGSIVLTHRRRPGVRRQKVAQQYARTVEDSMDIVKITPKTGA